MAKGVPLTKEQINERLTKIRPLLYEGYSLDSIAKRLKLTTSTVSYTIRIHGNDADRQQVRKNWEASRNKSKGSLNRIKIGYGEKRLFDALINEGLKSGQEFIWQYSVEDGFTSHVVDFYFPQDGLIVEVDGIRTDNVYNLPSDKVWENIGYRVVHLNAHFCEKFPKKAVKEINKLREKGVGDIEQERSQKEGERNNSLFRTQRTLPGTKQLRKSCRTEAGDTR